MLFAAPDVAAASVVATSAAAAPDDDDGAEAKAEAGPDATSASE